MSSNKTVVPGMEDAYKEQPSTFANPNANFFGAVPNNANMPATMPNQKPIVGFLYSVSKSGFGEFWPLRIGSNSIGRSLDSDICLREATVSEQHAVLVVRQMKKPEKIIASVCDSRSTCGTMINGESLGFDPRECFNGDIITIGEHYDLYFILIDAKQIGLNVCSEFMDAQALGSGVYNAIPQDNSFVPPVFNTPTQGGFEHGNTAAGGTVGFNEPNNETKPVSNPGGTVFM